MTSTRSILQCRNYIGYSYTFYNTSPSQTKYVKCFKSEIQHICADLTDSQRPICSSFLSVWSYELSTNVFMIVAAIPSPNINVRTH